MARGGRGPSGERIVREVWVGACASGIIPWGGKHALLGELVGRPAYKAAEFPDPPPRAVDG